MQYRIYKDQQKISETSNKQFVIQNLKPKTTYTFSVSAYNGLREGTKANLTLTTRGLIMTVAKALPFNSEVTLEYVEYPLGLVPLGTEPEGMFGGGNKQTLKGNVISSENSVSRVELKTSFDELPDGLKLKTDLQVPGLNFLQGSLDFTWPGGVLVAGRGTVTFEADDVGKKAHIVNGSSNGGIYTKFSDAFPNGEIQVGDNYTISFEAKGNGKFSAVRNESDPNFGLVNEPLTSDWKRYSFSGKITTLGKAYVIYFQTNNDVYVRRVKIEKGSQPTPWSPAREDIYGTTKVDESYSGFNGYKAIYLQ